MPCFARENSLHPDRRTTTCESIPCDKLRDDLHTAFRRANPNQPAVYNKVILWLIRWCGRTDRSNHPDHPDYTCTEAVKRTIQIRELFSKHFGAEVKEIWFNERDRERDQGDQILRDFMRPISFGDEGEVHIVFYAGYGFTSAGQFGELYLTPRPTPNRNVRGQQSQYDTQKPKVNLHAMLDSILFTPARVWCILDCCFAGHLRSGGKVEFLAASAVPSITRTMMLDSEKVPGSLSFTEALCKTIQSFKRPFNVAHLHACMIQEWTGRDGTQPCLCEMPVHHMANNKMDSIVLYPESPSPKHEILAPQPTLTRLNKKDSKLKVLLEVNLEADLKSYGSLPSTSAQRKGEDVAAWLRDHVVPCGVANGEIELQAVYRRRPNSTSASAASTSTHAFASTFPSTSTSTTANASASSSASIATYAVVITIPIEVWDLLADRTWVSWYIFHGYVCSSNLLLEK